jgi:hypothetical protein
MTGAVRIDADGYAVFDVGGSTKKLQLTSADASQMTISNNGLQLTSSNATTPAISGAGWSFQPSGDLFVGNKPLGWVVFQGDDEPLVLFEREIRALAEYLSTPYLPVRNALRVEGEQLAEWDQALQGLVSMVEQVEDGAGDEVLTLAHFTDVGDAIEVLLQKPTAVRKLAAVVASGPIEIRAA